MKKLVAITVFAAVLVMGCKQLKEVEAVEQALKAKNYQGALSDLDKLKSVLDTLQEEDKQKYYPMYYHYKVLALYAGGKNIKGNFTTGKAFLDLENYEKEIGVQKYTTPTKYVLDTVIAKIFSKAVDSYNAKDFKISSRSFLEVYKLQPKDTSALENAALTALQAKEYDTSIDFYEKLRSMGYTGIKKQFKALDKDGKPLSFRSKSAMDLQAKLGLAKNPQVVLTESKVGGIIKNLALAYIAKGEKQEALKAIENAKKMFPNDYMLIVNEANIYYELGDNEKFLKGLSKAIELQPENPVLRYNVGVMTMGQTDDNYKKLSEMNKEYEANLKKLKKNRRKNRKKIKQLEKTYKAARAEVEALNNQLLKKAEDSFRSAIELKADYVDAYTNLGVVILKKTIPIVEEMNNNLSNFKKYDALMVKKKAVEKQALPYFEKAHALEPKNGDTIKSLIGLYEALEMEKERKAMMAKRESL